jgi:hypothetical protein
LLRDVKILLYNLIKIYFSSSAILQEIYFESGKDIQEFFPWLGMLGAVITLGESFLLNEIPRIIVEKFSYDIILLWSGFAVTLVIFTSIAPFFIKRSSAAMFNISLVSQIFWSYIVEVIFNDSSPKGYEYYAGFVIIILGIYIFHKYPVTQLRRNYGFINNEEYLKCLINGEEIIRNPSVFCSDGKSESSSTSAFSTDKKVEYYRKISLYNKSNNNIAEH